MIFIWWSVHGFLLGFKILDFMLGLHLWVFNLLFIDLWSESNGVSESFESELESGGFTKAVIFVLVLIPKNP